MWSLGTGIVATVGANLAHGVGHGPVGALVSAWPALALVGSFELLMMLIRTGRGRRAGEAGGEPRYQAVPPLAHEAPLELSVAPTLKQTVHARPEAGHRQRAIAANSTLTAARSSASSNKQHDSADRPEVDGHRPHRPTRVRRPGHAEVSELHIHVFMRCPTCPLEAELKL